MSASNHPGTMAATSSNAAIHHSKTPWAGTIQRRFAQASRKYGRSLTVSHSGLIGLRPALGPEHQRICVFDVDQLQLVTRLQSLRPDGNAACKCERTVVPCAR